MRLVAALLSVTALCLAQTGNGNIQGTIKDPSGAIVPKAKVTALHTSTNREFKTETNEVGFYLLPSVPGGAWQLSVELAGMETWKGTLTLVAGQSAVVDALLKPGTTTTAVTVAGDVTPLITTNSPTLATVIERERIEQLPLNGRYITNLLYMTTPGVESGSVPRVYGLRYATELLQDGAVLENREWQSTPARPPGLDTISEFRSETNNSSAKLNRPGTFMITTRSGTNEIHGSAFETARNSGLGVARARQDFFTKPPHLVRNEFGASLGAPVFIPKVYNGRNRTFFFFAYEGFQLRQASTRNIAVPTEAMRGGDFSGLVDGQGRRFTIYDALSTGSKEANWSRVPFTGNRIPVARETPLAKYLYGITPLPTQPDNPLVTSNWFGLGFNNTKQHTETVRIDHKINDSNHLFFRYSHSPSTAARTSDPYGLSPTTLDQRANAYIDSQVNDSGIANWTHTFSPTFFSETLVTVARDYRGQLPFTGTDEIATGLGLPNPFSGIGFPRIPYSMSASTGVGMAYDSSINPTINYGRIYNFDQNFTKIHYRHELQFGALLPLRAARDPERSTDFARASSITIISRPPVSTIPRRAAPILLSLSPVTPQPTSSGLRHLPGTLQSFLVSSASPRARRISARQLQSELAGSRSTSVCAMSTPAQSTSATRRSSVSTKAARRSCSLAPLTNLPK
ncbi:MAG: carboxypeptidase-like regulatory domain-containing protein [Bryobacteraceae bacterium]